MNAVSGAGLSISDLSQALLAQVLEFVRAVDAELLAVVVDGSYARGEADADSDLDVTALYAQVPPVDWRSLFIARPARPLHVSAGAMALTQWQEQSARPADWSLGFPTDEPGVLLWATAAVRALLADPPRVRRPAPPAELEDLLEAAIKVKRGLRSGDAAGARLHAHAMALLAPGLLLPLNPERRVATPRAALVAALALPHVPPHYPSDLAVCLGVEGADAARFAEAGLRLPREMLAFLREHLPGGPWQPFLSQYLIDGTLERHLSA